MNDATTSIIKRFATIEFTDEEDCTSRWVWELPDYLLGTVKPGSVVAVRHEGRIKNGEVVDLSATTKYRPDQVGTVMDAIDVERFDAYVEERLRREQLLSRMEEQAALAQKVETYRQIAEFDPAMAEMLREYLGEDAEADEVLEEVHGEVLLE